MTRPGKNHQPVEMSEVSVTDIQDRSAFENDLDVSEIYVELGPLNNRVMKIESQIVSNLHYTQTINDLAFAVSVTDEIINLEPLDDKLEVLKYKSELSINQIISLIKQRLSFFSLYNLFDTVEHNYIDNQAMIQKLLMHIKN